MFSTAIAFINRNLLPILIFVIAGIVWWQITSIVNERDQAIQEYTELKHALDIAKSENIGKLAALKAEGERNQASQQKQHIADIQHIGNQYGKVIKDDKDAISYRNAVISQLRKQQAANSSNGVPKDDAGQLATGDSHSDITGRGEEFWQHAYSGAQEYIHVLKQAGAMCAADYNACHIYVNSEQKRLGIEGFD